MPLIPELGSVLPPGSRHKRRMLYDTVVYPRSNHTSDPRADPRVLAGNTEPRDCCSSHSDGSTFWPIHRLRDAVSTRIHSGTTHSATGNQFRRRNRLLFLPRHSIHSGSNLGGWLRV
ncbi:hypothetical protein DPMN_173136 [Dreissena polymorpha]|uniref:Uncharacterized protein n=1 Tax=Dreissena polymorpha TaxID=45954 RepID=A0A9D4E129_DREPO|nr:hypothetical protein DPMN_173136 [Dreissena polymorpha]